MRILPGLMALVVTCTPVYSQRRVKKNPAAKVVPRAVGPQQGGPKTLDSLERMSPQQRQKLLEGLPPDRARSLQERLDRYDRLPPDQRQRLKDQYDRFSQLPPERQAAMRKVFERFNRLSQDRQDAVRQEFNGFHGLSDDEKRARMRSAEFRSRYSRDEQKLIDEMSSAAPR